MYDRKRHGEFYQAGDLVWLHSSVVPRGASRKLHRPWTGLYKIIKKLADVTYRIQNCTGWRHRLVVHFDRLKPCHQDMRMEGSLQNKTTSPAIHKLRNVACEQSTLPTVHDSEDDSYEETLNSNVEQDGQEEMEEHCSPKSADAVNSPPVEIDSDLHQEAATVPPDRIGNDHQDVSSNVHQGQQEVSEEHNHADNHSPGLANVPPVGSDGEITHTDADVCRYPRRSH